MADGGWDRGLEGLRGVDSGKVSVIEADSINGLELLHHGHHFGLVLEAVNHESLEENGIGSFKLFAAIFWFADPHTVFVVKPDQDWFFKSSHRDAGDDEHHAEERDDAGDDRNEVILKQNFAAKKEGLLVPGMDEIWASDVDQIRLGRRARNALRVAYDVEVCVDEGAKFSNELALTMPPFNEFKIFDCGCGSVGRAVDYDTRGPWFESSHRQKFINIEHLYTVNCVLKRRK